MEGQLRQPFPVFPVHIVDTEFDKCSKHFRTPFFPRVARITEGQLDCKRLSR